MIYKEVAYILFIGHFLGDYYFQTDKMANKQNPKTLLKHSLVYMGTLFLVIYPLFHDRILFLTVFLIGISHSIIDFAKYFYKKHKEVSDSQTVLLYIFDQILHLAIIAISASILLINQTNINYNARIENIFYSLNLYPEVIFSWLLILLVIFKPASITIRIVLNHFEPPIKREENMGVSNAGALIGIFERLIILLMLYAGQFTAIGFVLTAKSVARYNKISEDPQFAEYYLLGTLLSSLIIIISYYLIF